MTKSVEERAKAAYDITRQLLPELFVADKEAFKATASRIARLEGQLLFRLHERSLLLNHVSHFVNASAADYRWLVDKYDAEHDGLTENYSGPGDESKDEYAFTPQESKEGKEEAGKFDRHMSEGPLEQSREDSKGSYGTPDGGEDGYPDKNMPKEWPTTASAEVAELKSELAELKELIKASYKYGLDDKEEDKAEKKADDEVEDAREAQSDSGASWTKASTEVEATVEPEASVELLEDQNDDAMDNYTLEASDVEASDVLAMEEEIELDEDLSMEEEDEFGEDDMLEAGFNMEEEDDFDLGDDMSAVYSAALESDHELMNLFGDDDMGVEASLEDIQDSVKLGGETNLPQALTRTAKKSKKSGDELKSLFSQD
jgi:hypothetical protein